MAPRPLDLQLARAAEPARGRKARTPVHIPWQGWKDILFRTYNEILNGRLMAVADGVVFYSLLSLFPAIAAGVNNGHSRGSGDRSSALLMTRSRHELRQLVAVRHFLMWRRNVPASVPSSEVIDGSGSSSLFDGGHSYCLPRAKLALLVPARSGPGPVFPPSLRYQSHRGAQRFRPVSCALSPASDPHDIPALNPLVFHTP